MFKLTALLVLVPSIALAQPAKPATPATPPAAPPAKAAPAAPATPAKGAPATTAPAPANPIAPVAPPEVKATVDAFKGNWRIDTTMTATGIPGFEKPFNGKATFNCKPTAMNTAVACDMKTKTPMGPFEGHFVVAYDPYSKAAHFIGITSMNEVHDHVCKWEGMNLNCSPLKAGMGPHGDEITEDLSMKFEGKGCEAGVTAATCKLKTMEFTSNSKMSKGGGTMLFQGKGKR